MSSKTLNMKAIPTLKIKKNLFIKNNYVISYETKVAKIKDNKLYELGRFSRTTSKHIYHVASLFNLEVVRSDQRQVFWKYEMGANCNTDWTCLSPTVSAVFLSGESKENDFPSIVNRLANLEKIPKKDAPLIERFLESNNFQVEDFQKLRKAIRLMQFV